MLNTFGAKLEPASLALGALARWPAQARMDSSLFLRLLDQVDQAILVVDQQGRILRSNQMARQELASARALQMRGARLEAMLDWETELLARAIERAVQGERTLLDLGHGGARLSVALVALGQPGDSAGEAVLVICGQRERCQALSMTFFARSHGLTPLEEQVLCELCLSSNPVQIGYKLGIGLATVRTQLDSVRQKTGTSTVRELLDHVLALPPLVTTQHLH